MCSFFDHLAKDFKFSIYIIFFMINIKRIYEAASSNDGLRILVDRLWPRGISKEEAKIDLWIKDIAPSTELRRWFHHDPSKWLDFQEKYTNELKRNMTSVSKLKNQVDRSSKVTFLYGAKDSQHNQALVLKKFIKKCDQLKRDSNTFKKIIFNYLKSQR